MKILIESQGKKRSVLIPNFLFLNTLALNKLKNTPGESDVPNISSKMFAKLRKTIREMRKLNKDWVFVEFYDHNGDHGKIKL